MLSEVIRGRKAPQVATPVIVLAECRDGICQSLERKRYERWLVEYLPAFDRMDVDEHFDLVAGLKRLDW